MITDFRELRSSLYQKIAVIVFIVLQFGLYGLATFVGQLFISDVIFLTLIVDVYFCVFWYSFIHYRDKDVKPKQTDPMFFLWIVGVVVFIYFASVNLYKLFPVVNEGRGNFGDSQYFIYLALIVAPLSEELIMRGIVFKELRRNFKAITAYLLTALIFAVLHKNVAQMFSAFCMSIVLCYVYEYTNRLSCCFGFHVFYNVLVLLGFDLTMGLSPIFGFIFCFAVIIGYCIYVFKQYDTDFQLGQNVLDKEELTRFFSH